MKCSVIRDLLPLYEEKLCRIETIKCYKLDTEHEFWMKYYGNLILRGVAIFLAVYIITISIGMILKM